MPNYSDLAGVTNDFSVSGKLNTTGGIVSRVVALTDGSSIAINAGTTDIGVLVLTQNATFANPSGSPVDGQKLQIRITSSLTRAISFGSAYQATSGKALPTATTGGGSEDYLDFQYNASDSKWDLVSSTFAGSNSSGISEELAIAYAVAL